MSDCIRSIKSSFFKIESYCKETVAIYKHQASSRQREIIIKTAMVAIATLCVGAPLIGGLGFILSGVSTAAAFAKITRAVRPALTAGAQNAEAQPSSVYPVIEPVTIRQAKGSALTESTSQSPISTAEPSLLEPVEPVMVSRRIAEPIAQSFQASTNDQPVRPLAASRVSTGSMLASVGIYASGVFNDWVVLPDGGHPTSLQ